MYWHLVLPYRDFALGTVYWPSSVPYEPPNDTGHGLETIRVFLKIDLKMLVEKILILLGLLNF